MAYYYYSTVIIYTLKWIDIVGDEVVHHSSYFIITDV